MTLKEDPHFEQIVVELKDIQSKVDSVLFGSVFLRVPHGLPDDKVPPIPEDQPSLNETLAGIEDALKKTAELEDRLKELLDNQNTASYEDQIEEYLRDLDESSKILLALKPTLAPESLREGQIGKSDVSWLSWRRNTLGSKLHKEINELQQIIDNESQDPEQIELKLKSLDGVIQTANTLHQSTQYLAWFNRRVVSYNESLPEFERDFTVNLVSQWVQEEANKVLEHHNNCMNVRSEIENKQAEQAS